MNEAETRAELIDPRLKDSGWGVVEGSKVLREFHITAGRILAGGKREKPAIADYVLVYKNRKIGVIEAKSDQQEVGEGVGQAKIYATKLGITYTYAANGKEIYEIVMGTGQEGLVSKFPTPDELWQKTFPPDSRKTGSVSCSHLQQARGKPSLPSKSLGNFSRHDGT